MKNESQLAEQFEQHRPHLHALAHRIRGSLSEAGDAVQEAWLRLSRSDAGHPSRECSARPPCDVRPGMRES